MKQYLALVVAVFGVIGKIHSFPADLPIYTNESGDRIWPVPQADSGIRWMSRSNSKSDKVNFYLYTQKNPTEPVEIDMEDPETLVRSTFDFRLPTSIMIHGWKDQYFGGANMVMRNALFGEAQNKRDLNFISVDWNVYSKYENYTVSQQLCSKAGKIVAQFIDWMHGNAKLQFDMLTLYGHSMGSQVAGFAGKNVQRGKIHTIIGMDPALPLFPYDNPKERLADTDAEYVESIHTNGGVWGFYEPIGQTAFYPNGGKYQPGCGDDLDGLCSHIRAVFYVAEALSSSEENNFLAVKCKQFEHVQDSKCDEYSSIIRMGDPGNVDKARGVYYLETNSESPYASGMKTKKLK